MREKITNPYEELSIPADFPRSAALLTLPKWEDSRLYSLYQGKYYLLGGSPPEVWTAWQMCDELVQHFIQECLAAMVISPLLPFEEIVLAHFEETLKRGWGTDAEIKWIFKHVALQLTAMQSR
ncbi:MAG: hypothetical protein JWQ21_2923 [Herminiimonas sp.]|nr:hypothetical protein [Herminiimonas sp.]